MFDQCPMPINANHIFMVLRLHASYGAKQNVLGGSVSQWYLACNLNLWSINNIIDPNVDQFRSIGIDRQWLALRCISDQCHDF